MTVPQDPQVAAGTISGFQLMDNAAYVGDSEQNSVKSTKEVRIPLQIRDTNSTVLAGPSSGASASGGGRVCRPEVCRRARLKYSQAQGSVSPWHKRKTLYLLGTIILLVIWIIVFATLSFLDII